MSLISPLIERLREQFSRSGEILNNEKIAEIIQDYEDADGCIFTASECIIAAAQAGSEFVDGMRENATLTWQEQQAAAANGKPQQYPRYESEEDYWAEMEKWENMRPSNVRRRAITAILNGGVTV